MSPKIMMYYGSRSEGEVFNATQWFTKGMYRPRNIEADGSASMITMIRTKAPDFSKQQLEELPFSVGQAFGLSSFDDLDTEPFEFSEPDLSKRYRYVYSSFDAPDVPVDYYEVYLDLFGRRFVATVSVDAQNGGEVTGRYVQEVYPDQPASADYIKVFAEIAEAERKAN